MTPSEVEDAVNDIIKGLFPKRGMDFKHEPINWAAVRCYEVRQFTDGSFYVVVIKAAPDSDKFCIEITTRLAAKGITATVKTEW